MEQGLGATTFGLINGNIVMEDPTKKRTRVLMIWRKMVMWKKTSMSMKYWLESTTWSRQSLVVELVDEMRRRRRKH